MSKTGRSRRSMAIHIDLRGISYDTTCVNSVPNGLPISIACEICYCKLDIYTKQSSQTSKKERQKHLTNKCKQ